MIDLIERLREEHYRKKGIPKYQNGDKTGLIDPTENSIEDAAPTVKDALSLSNGSGNSKNEATGPFKDFMTNISSTTSGNYKGPEQKKASNWRGPGYETLTESPRLEPKPITTVDNPVKNQPVIQAPKDPKKEKSSTLLSDFFSYFTPNDLQTNLQSFGRMLKFKPKTSGQKASKIGSLIGYGGASLLGATREVVGGMGIQNQNNLAEAYNNKLLAERKYTNAPATASYNNTGNFSTFQDGGEQEMLSQEEQQPQEEQQMAPEEQQQPQEGQEMPPQKILDIANQLVENFENIETIDKYLRQNKVDERTYSMIMEAAQDIIEANSEEEEPEEEEGTEEEGPEGMKEGDYVEFEHGGKMHKGRISKIKNGKIYL